VPSHFLDALLGAVFAGVITIIITVLVERLRAPHLTLSIEPPLEMAPRGPFAQKWRSLRVKVTNESLPRWANWWMLRSPGQQCRAQIAFLRADGTLFLDKAITGRWTGSPEPLVAYIATSSGGTAAVLTNPQQLRATIDVYPGETELLDVAVRVDGEHDCYSWNDETYFYQNWRNPNCRLGRGIYLVEVTVTSSGKKCRDYFRLANDGPFAALRLAQPTPTEREAVRGGARA
jgi:hypothetical protein